MPASIRPKGKAQRIAFNILGSPSNQGKRKSRRSKAEVSENETEKRIVVEDTRFVR